MSFYWESESNQYMTLRDGEDGPSRVLLTSLAPHFATRSHSKPCWMVDAVSDPDHSISIELGYVLFDIVPNAEIVDESTPEMLASIAAKCAEARLNKVLVRAPSPIVKLTTMGLFETGKAIADSQLKTAIYTTDHNSNAEDMEFMETVAENRAGFVRFFDDEPEALDWLGVCAADKCRPTK